jgi:hypothetical protein
MFIRKDFIAFLRAVKNTMFKVIGEILQEVIRETKDIGDEALQISPFQNSKVNSGLTSIAASPVSTSGHD